MKPDFVGSIKKMLLAVVPFTVFSLRYVSVEGSQLEVPTKKHPGFSSGFGYNPKFIITVILLHEEFLQFDWLRAVVFQLTVGTVTKMSKA